MNHDLHESGANVLQERPSSPSAAERPHRFRPSRGTLVSVGAAVLVSAVSIYASARFRRAPPAPPAESRDMKVKDGRISLASGAPQWESVALGRAEPGREHWSDPVPADIRVDEAVTARVGAPLGGRVDKVFVELGQPVKAGDALFSVTSPSLASLNAERAKASVELDTAKTVLERVKAIVAARALPEKEELAAEQQLRQARVDYQVAESKLGSLRVASRSYNEYVVKSPRDGDVVDKSVLPGQQIAEDATTLMMVADLSSVWVVAQLFEADASGVERGSRARITVASLPGATIEGTVEMVSSVVDPATRSVPVRVRLDNRDRKLKPNTYAHMQFLAAPAPGAVEIAATAIVSDGARQYVYVRGTDGAFGRREVVAGPIREGRILVMSGLAAGETVVERGSVLLDNQIDLAE
ncbi:MAG: efflux RND transporter periplasmic adaptor subunit [Sorangiineae bacterium]|nr:efflux RND transporter periplasmic adaptor subunit [Polyangiaceae bacterium]MEB2322943.1 efflux RND transporter periplasmic adaptor subunit [Sorangiineae bacterium]